MSSQPPSLSSPRTDRGSIDVDYRLLPDVEPNQIWDSALNNNFWTLEQVKNWTLKLLNLTLNQTNFSGGSAALVATFKSTINLDLNVILFLQDNRTLKFHIYHGLALLRVAMNPPSVGWPTPKTGKPFTWSHNKRFSQFSSSHFEVNHQSYQIHNLIKVMKTCLKFAAPSTFSTSSGRRCIPATTNILKKVAKNIT